MKTNLIILLILFFCSCNKDSTRVEKIAHVKEIKSEDFNEFSELFYSDSLFQLSRIDFPLSGIHYIEVEDSTSLGYSVVNKWEKKDWFILKENTFKNTDSVQCIDGEIYKRKTNKTDTSYCDSVYIEDSGFSVTKKFLLINKKWYLVYYSECND